MQKLWRISFLIFFASLAHGRSEPKHCGISNPNPFADRIVGGTESEPHEFPWLVKIIKNHNFHCGGSLISDRHVLSAGHCVTMGKGGDEPLEPRKERPQGVVNYVVFDPTDFVVEMGAHLYAENPDDVTRRYVKQIFLHPDYDLFSSRDTMVQTNDISILKFDPVRFSRTVAPICLPGEGSKVRDGAKLIVAGWGSINSEIIGDPLTEMPKALQKTDVMKIPFVTCQKNKYVGWLLTEEDGLTEKAIFCGLGNNTDSCRGDSGGAAMLKTKEGFVLVGVVSWGIGCNQRNYPAAYTRVSSYMDFVEAHTRDALWLPTLKQG